MGEKRHLEKSVLEQAVHSLQGVNAELQQKLAAALDENARLIEQIKANGGSIEDEEGDADGKD